VQLSHHRPNPKPLALTPAQASCFGTKAGLASGRQAAAASSRGRGEDERGGQRAQLHATQAGGGVGEWGHAAHALPVVKTNEGGSVPNYMQPRLMTESVSGDMRLTPSP
jgi:hypothetical protein